MARYKRSSKKTRRRYRKRRFKRRYKLKLRRRIFKKKFTKKKRGTSKVYQHRQTQGIKWTRYLSLVDFLTDDKPELYQVLGAAALNKSPGNNHAFYSSFVTQADTELNQIFNCLSSEYMTAKTLAIPINQAKQVFWKSYSPTPSERNMGPLFNSFINLYTKFKFVGIKVKWIPQLKAAPAFLPFTKSDVVQRSGVNTIDQVPLDPTQVGRALNIGGTLNNTTVLVDCKDLKTHEIETMPLNRSYFSYTPGLANNTRQIQLDTTNFPNACSDGYSRFPSFQSPPQLRFWINFEKTGYESSNNLSTRIVQGINTSTVPNETVTNCRNRFASVFNKENGRRVACNERLIKSYNLNRPFKFFVKPKFATRYHEMPENQTMMANAEQPSAYQDSLKQKDAQTQQLMQLNKKMPYISIINLWPTNSLYAANFVNSSADVANIQMLNDLKSDGWFDPILFGWNLTCDNIDLPYQIDPFYVSYLPQYGATTGHNFKNVRIKIDNYLQSMGKFKVTYYAKFKGLRNQYFVPVTLEAQRNATGDID